MRPERIDMSPSFFSRLERRARQVDSLLCVGLDPHPEELPAHTPSALRDYCFRLISATHDLVLAYKPNAAFFEAFGPEGWKVLAEVIAAIPDDIPVVLDAKRGDISSTAEAYAVSAFENLKTNALTVNPYLGRDAVQPFIKDPAHGAFILCKTSNPGSADLQDAELVNGGRRLAVYEKVALLAQKWNENDNIGLVVGATFPEALRRVRKLAPDLWFLAPGVGAQGGDLKAALAAGLRQDGMGMLMPVSRQISRAADPRQAGMLINEQVRQVRDELANTKIEEQITADFPATLADGLLEAGCVQFGSFTLKSGLQSPIYIDLRRLASLPNLLAEAAAAYGKELEKLEFDRLAGLPYAALPIATAISLKFGWPLIYPRKEAKTYGTKAEIEGIFNSGERAAVIDDLATTGKSKFEAIDKLKSAGLVVRDVVVLIDRQSGASESLAKAGYQLHAVVTLTGLLDYWQSQAKVSPEKIQAVREFLVKTV
jgi:uridine monophosphate synthetase